MNTKHRRIFFTLMVILIILLFMPDYARAQANISRLEYAYLDASMSFLISGEDVTVTMVVPDTSGLEFEFTLFYTDDRETSSSFLSTESQTRSSMQDFTFIPHASGEYFVQATIFDSQDRSKTIQSQVFYAYESEDRYDQSKLPGKVLSIVNQARSQNLSSEYDQALWLHDWLTHNADYDVSMTMNSPEGVLLHGTGVCESYTLAYQMLLHELGIDNIYVTGYGNGGAHAWLLVSLDGEWVHIDPTWGDPVGGEEGHDYFGLNDYLISRDHSWNEGEENNLLPKSTSLNYHYHLRNGAKAFTTEEELHTVLNDGIAVKESNIVYIYLGNNVNVSIMDWVQKWVDANINSIPVSSLEWGGTDFAGKMKLTYR